jgi:mono/diheme cytochrome c family protein
MLATASVVVVTKALSPTAQKSAEDTYLDKCSVCHGKDGAGKTAKGKKVKAKDINDTIKTMSEDEMIKIVNEGKGKDMDSFKKELPPSEIKALVEYYRGLAKK